MGYQAGPPPTAKPRPHSDYDNLVGEALALVFADDAHHLAGQLYDNRPYSSHLKQVVAILTEFGYLDEETRQAGYLHDILEDTPVTMDDLLAQGFSRPVVWAVCFCTDEEGHNRKTRKEFTYARMRQAIGERPDEPEVHRGVRVKLADRLANIRYCIATKNKGLFKMYRKEEVAFGQALRHPGICDEMWVEYDRLLEGGLGSPVFILE